jgi:hypothetical protein
VLRLGAVIFVFFVFLGGMMGGWPPYWGRLPGPYEVGASELSVEPQGVQGAYWAYDLLGPHNRIDTDFTNHLLQGAYGEQNASYHSPEVFTSPILTYANQRRLNSLSIEYLLVDYRLTEDLPTRGFYFNAYEPDAFEHQKPIDAQSLDKFDLMSNVSRVFDSGDIIIYDVLDLSNRPPVLRQEE